MCRENTTSLRSLAAMPAVFVAVAIGAYAGCGLEAAGPPAEISAQREVGATLASETAEAPDEQACQQLTDPFLVPLPQRQGKVRVLAVSERPLGRARLLAEDGTALAETPVMEVGPPYGRIYSEATPRTTPRGARHAGDGKRRLRLVRWESGLAEASEEEVACVEVSSGQALDLRKAPSSGVWETTRLWDDGWERAFSAWIAWLFRPLPGQQEGWRPLHQVLRNPERNLLYDALGLGEDSGRAPGSEDRDPRAPRVIAWADCGDVPYQLRAYFAWKQGLPFRFRRCSRGTGTRGPQCSEERDNSFGGHDAVAHPVARLNAFLREGLAWLVHSGTTRTLPEDEGSDFYPIRLSRETIRPGTIFVDVGGHVLVVTQWDASGLYAIDGHPDFSVTRRRFSPEYFRYFRGTRTGGFKAFRPLRLVEDRLVPLPNRRVRSAFSVEQYDFASGQDFYQTMGFIIATIRG